MVQRFVVAAVGDDRPAVVERRGVDGCTQSFQQLFHSPALAGGEGQCSVGQRYRCGCRIYPVDFVGDQDAALVGPEVEGLDGGVGGIEHLQDDLRAGDTGVSTFDAHALDRVVGRAQTRRIDKPVENAVEVQRGFDRIACRAGNFGYQRPLLVKQTVEQRAFPDVGAADDCDGDTLLDGVAQGEGVDQPVDLRTDPLHCSAEFRAVGEFDLFLAEIASGRWPVYVPHANPKRSGRRPLRPATGRACRRERRAK